MNKEESEAREFSPLVVKVQEVSLPTAFCSALKTWTEPFCRYSEQWFIFEP